MILNGITKMGKEMERDAAMAEAREEGEVVENKTFVKIPVIGRLGDGEGKVDESSANDEAKASDANGAQSSSDGKGNGTGNGNGNGA